MARFQCRASWWRLLVVAVTFIFAGAGCGSPQVKDEKNAKPVGASANAEPDAAEPQDPAPAANRQADEVFGEMARDAEARKREAAHFVQLADKAFQEADYARAKTLYERALHLDPTLTEAKHNLVICKMFLGERDGEIMTTIEEFADATKVATQEVVSEARRFVDEGEKAYQAGDLDLALNKLARARDLYAWHRFEGVDVSADKARAESLFQEVLQKKDAAMREESANQEEIAKQRAEELRLQDEQRQSDWVTRTMKRAREGMASREYAKVVELTTEVIKRDAGHKQARKLRNEAMELENDQRYMHYLDDDESEIDGVRTSLDEASTPYSDPFHFGNDDDYWRLVVQSRESKLVTASLDETAEVQKIRRTLATLPVETDFQKNTLNDVVAFLRTVSDLNITIDPEIDAEGTLVDLKVADVKLEDALNLILKNTGLGYTFRENTLYITTKEKAHGNIIFDIYNVTDILNKVRDFPGPTIRVRSNDDVDESEATPFGFETADDEEGESLTPEDLAKLITDSTGGETLWTEAGSAIEGQRGQLLVNATRELHVAVKNFLQNLRKDSDLFVIVEARFIDLLDDFLEDIGVDSRNLGRPPGTGFGTAYGTLNSASSGGTDQGFNNLGNPTNPSLIAGQDRTAGRVQHILDGFAGAASGTRLNGALKGLTAQITWLDPFQVNAIIRATQETRIGRTVTAPRVTASNGQRVHVSVITQRAYVQDYELVSGGTGLIVQEVADPVVATFQEGVILDVEPVISSDRKYVTIDVRPTLASLINGVISTVVVNLGSLQQAAAAVDIDLPEISLQQAFTSVTVPDGGTVLLGGFRGMNERKSKAFIPLLGRIPIVNLIFSRRALVDERRSLYILLTARVVDLRAAEKRLYN